RGDDDGRPGARVPGPRPAAAWGLPRPPRPLSHPGRRQRALRLDPGGPRPHRLLDDLALLPPARHRPGADPPRPGIRLRHRPGLVRALAPAGPRRPAAAAVADAAPERARPGRRRPAGHAAGLAAAAAPRAHRARLSAPD